MSFSGILATSPQRLLSLRRMLNANNVGAFYKFVNNKVGRNHGVGPLSMNNVIFTSDWDKAAILNQYFESVFTNDNNILPDFPMRVNDCIDDIHVSPSIVLKILKKLKVNSAAGPDRLPPVFFNKTASVIAYPLSVIFRNLIDLRSLPSEWKISHVTPVFKKGAPTDPSNYRPISLNSCCCKILESIIAQDLLEFLDTHKLISKHQHGFLKKHSTTTNLLESLNDWSVSLSNNRSVVVAYIDFHRAFDSISHVKLIHKLKAYGIGGNLLAWISVFLINRFQRVRVGSSLSNLGPVISGVPQGSVLGPLLFNLFVNDLTDFFDPSVHSKLYADDVKIYSDISDPTLSSNIQIHLDAIKLWASKWQLVISESKCNILHLSLSKSKSRPNFSFSDSAIPSVDSVSDLGILFDSHLCFRSHINNIVCRAKQRAALIHRCFFSRDIGNLVRAFKVYVRPLVECSPQIWSPSNVGLINLIESIQRSFTKRLPGFQNLSYSDRLTKLKLQSLEHRRLIFDLMLCYKIVHGSSAILFSDFFSLPNNQNLRGHPFRISIPIARNNIRKHFFAVRVIPIWNSLPLNLVTSPTEAIFKRRILKHNLANHLILPSFFLSNIN